MKIADLVLNVDQTGLLWIPAEVVREMGFKAGDAVHIAYFTHDGTKNSFHELVVFSEGGQNALRTAEHTIQVPSELMLQAHLSEDEDMQIICLDGAILICRDTALNVAEIQGVQDQLMMLNNLAMMLPDDVKELQAQLTEIIEKYEGSDD